MQDLDYWNSAETVNTVGCDATYPGLAFDSISDMLTIEPTTSFNLDEIRDLYDSVGWSVYTSNMNLLLTGLANSDRVVVAREDARLVGLSRVISDSATIAYLQDILVHPDFRRRGIATRLVQVAFEPFAEVRQKVLITDAEPVQRAFYESLSFTEIRDLDEHGLRAFVKFM